MKSIIKPGYQEDLSQAKAKQFHCAHCGCIFKATWSDYNMILYPDKEYYSECPTCGRDAGEQFDEKTQ